MAALGMIALCSMPGKGDQSAQAWHPPSFLPSECPHSRIEDCGFSVGRDVLALLGLGR